MYEGGDADGVTGRAGVAAKLPELTEEEKRLQEEELERKLEEERKIRHEEERVRKEKARKRKSPLHSDFLY